jgi:hypothetical protein
LRQRAEPPRQPRQAGRERFDMKHDRRSGKADTGRTCPNLAELIVPPRPLTAACGGVDGTPSALAVFRQRLATTLGKRV